MMGVSVIAAFMWPSLFLGGACAVSVPVIIHLLARRRFKRIRWAAMAFLLQAERRNRRRIRLEDLILMLLRCLAVALIGMLVARPFVRPAGLAALLGGSERTERIFVLDDSFSMGYEAGDETVFDRAKRGVVRIIELLSEQSPHDTVTVLRTSAMDTPVASGVFLDARQTQELFNRLEGVKVSQRALSVRDMFVSLRRLLDERSQTVSAAVYVLSDFQRKDWASGTGGGSSPAAALAGAGVAGEADRGVKLILVDVGVVSAPNQALTSLTSPRGRFVAAVNESVEATVANFSDRAREAVDLEVTVGASVQPTVTVHQVAARASASVPVSVAFARPGWNWLRVSTEPDALPVDDRRTLVVETVEAVRVLVVDGEPSSDSYRDEVTLLVTALRPPGEVFSGNEVRTIDETELEEAELDRFDVVILANVYRVSEPAAAALERFAGGGGGVAVMLGDQVDPDFYNATLYREGRGVLPARLGDRRAPPSAVRLAADDATHPMVRVLAGRENPFVKRIRFEQYFWCSVHRVDGAGGVGEVDPEGAEVGETDGGKAPGAGEAADPWGNPGRTIAHFEDAERTPAVMERAYGSGRVLLFASSCDLEWNDWVKDPSYVVAMLQMVHYLGRGRAASEVVVGAPITFAIDPAEYDADVLVRTPAYPAEQEIALTAVPAEDGRGFRVRWARTDRPGVYRFVLTRRTGEQVVRAVAVNLDASESDLTFASKSDLDRSLRGTPFTYVDGLKSLDVVGEEARRELWKTVLLAVLVVLMGEQFLGWWFGRRA